MRTTRLLRTKRLLSSVFVASVISSPLLFVRMLATTATLALISGLTSARSGQLEPESGDTVRLLYEFPYNTYLENIAVRPNGQFLITPLSLPQLWLVEPDLPGEAFIVCEFPEVLGLSGIVEYQPDIFAVLTGNFSFSTGDPGLGNMGHLEYRPLRCPRHVQPDHCSIPAGCEKDSSYS